jgi:hypothetical protein
VERTASVEKIPRAMRFASAERGITTSKLEILPERKGNHAGLSAFFARRKWTLEDAYQFVRGLIGLIFVYDVLVQSWFPWGIPETPIGGSRVSCRPSGGQEVQNGKTAA